MTQMSLERTIFQHHDNYVQWGKFELTLCKRPVCLLYDLRCFKFDKHFYGQRLYALFAGGRGTFQSTGIAVRLAGTSILGGGGGVASKYEVI